MEHGKKAQALWEDYRFLTKEMIKFLARQEMELFNELMNQRERLQAMLDQAEDQEFKVSAVGQTMLAEIHQDNRTIIKNMQVLLNRGKQFNQVSEVYNGLSTTAVSQMNWIR